jgi:hypothetical protein
MRMKAGFFLCFAHGTGKAVSTQYLGCGLRLGGQEPGLDGPHVLQQGQSAVDLRVLGLPGKLNSDFRFILMYT